MGAGNQKRKIIGLAATSAPMSAVFSFSHGGFFHTPSAWECVPRSSASHSSPRNRPQNKPQQRPLPQKTTPRAVSPEAARRRMTTPVVAPRSGLLLPRHRSNPQRKNNIVIPEFSFHTSGTKTSGISRDSGSELHGKSKNDSALVKLGFAGERIGQKLPRGKRFGEK